jgi:hypothetical protein
VAARRSARLRLHAIGLISGAVWSLAAVPRANDPLAKRVGDLNLSLSQQTRSPFRSTHVQWIAAGEIPMMSVSGRQTQSIEDILIGGGK